MSVHLSEEEQLESLKRWWKENGLQTLLTVVLVTGGWFGWQFWQDFNQEQAEAASLQYIEMMDIAASPVNSEEQLAKFTHLAHTLKDHYENSHYAHFAALILARRAIDENDLQTAREELEWVLANNSDEALEHIVSLRLARVRAELGEIDAALALVEKSPEGFASIFAEARGDFYLLENNAEAARAAYQSALDVLPIRCHIIIVLWDRIRIGHNQSAQFIGNSKSILNHFRLVHTH